MTLFFVRFTVAAGLEIVAAESEKARSAKIKMTDVSFFITLIVPFHVDVVDES